MADTLLLTVPNPLGIEYNAYLLDSLVRYVAPEARVALSQESAYPASRALTTRSARSRAWTLVRTVDT